MNPAMQKTCDESDKNHSPISDALFGQEREPQSPNNILLFLFWKKGGSGVMLLSAIADHTSKVCCRNYSTIESQVTGGATRLDRAWIHGMPCPWSMESLPGKAWWFESFGLDMLPCKSLHFSSYRLKGQLPLTTYARTPFLTALTQPSGLSLTFTGFQTLYPWLESIMETLVYLVVWFLLGEWIVWNYGYTCTKPWINFGECGCRHQCCSMAF